MKTKSINFAKFSSFKIGATIDVALLDSCETPTNDYYIIGSCNNILIGVQPPPLMKLDKKYDYIKIENNTLKIGGATPSGKIASFCKKHNIANFEFVSHLPGTLGGLVFMNAGLKEFEIFNNLISISTCTVRNEETHFGRKVIFKQDISFGYRYTDISSPILEATFSLTYGFDEKKVDVFKKMRSNQPSMPSAGSCFKNPKGDYAGRLIEEVGLKGFKAGDMEFSPEHANFLVNNNNGTFDDAIFLIQEAQRKVYEKFGIWLECEIGVLDIRYMGKDSKLLNPYM
ncbi:UDP-N-acetylmuramate dehydrogenase [Candidatus Sulfurimonas marisnigri]|uniref:UDP-N-acetylenolpyruvoylglucosamine reductase n=1 Tax=Candidatus Sulfurimonas marisnigri TaxID=2740405 RepID=A0A7S7RQL2_9BACT|nr:UDP-N-acetylmuramate dehydrogenase [Candidatus Sulfurimonas marisnigri]QOY54585.1 UDP-N-acetylmuramate dehydrogenase [Candidatus Sulfurimonas marisnigri]